MPVTCDNLQLSYYPVPKVACTSLKMLFWELAHGRPYRPRLRLGSMRRPQHTGIHSVEGYRTRSWNASPLPPAGCETLVVVRDPIARLHSAWRNKATRRVLARGELEDLTDEGLPHEPDFGTFVDRLEAYRFVSRPVRIHTHPLAWHLGPDLGFFDHVFELERVDALLGLLSARAGRPVSMPRRNASEVDVRSDALTAAQRARLAELTAPDYAWLRGRYDAEASLARFA